MRNMGEKLDVDKSNEGRLEWYCHCGTWNNWNRDVCSYCKEDMRDTGCDIRKKIAEGRYDYLNFKEHN